MVRRSSVGPTSPSTQIHRQALESPIIRQAHAVRDGGAYQPDTADFQVVRKAGDEQMMAADTILCWRNVTRHKVNARMRSLLGYNLPYPQAGEPVLCLKNAHRYGIFNGVTYELARNFEPDDESHPSDDRWRRGRGAEVRVCRKGR